MASVPGTPNDYLKLRLPDLPFYTEDNMNAPLTTVIPDVQSCADMRHLAINKAGRDMNIPAV